MAKSLVTTCEIQGRLYGDLYAVGIAENLNGSECNFRERLTAKEKDLFIKLCDRISKRLGKVEWVIEDED